MKNLVPAALLAAVLSYASSVNAQDCPLEGSAHSLKVQALNIEKNREVAPRPDEMDASVSLEVLLASGDDSDRWSETSGATIVGYVVGVKPGGIETTNCGARAIKDRDTHIELALTPDGPENERIIVEVTPRWRAIMADEGLDWRTQALRKSLLHHRSKVTGWLLFDFEHKGQAENTAPGNSRNWRGSAWEIHPITDIQILQ